MSPVIKGGVFYCVNRAGNTSDSHVRPILQDTRIALFLLEQLIAALQANDPETFKRGGIQDLGEPAVTELLLDWIDPFITRVERERMIVWHLGVSL